MDVYQTDDIRKRIGIYLHACKSRNLAVGTIEFYDKKLTAFVQFGLKHAITNINQIRADHIREFPIWLEETGHRPAGIHCYYRSIKTFLKWYERETEPVDWRNPINKVDAYIPDIQFRKRDPRIADEQRFQDGIHGRQRPVAKPSLFTSSDFSFDPTKQVYRCPQGKELTCHARNQTNRYRTYAVYRARVQDCAACSVKARCLSKPTTSRRYLSIQVDTQQTNLIDAMKAKIDTEQGKQIYARRLGIVEPVFANIWVQKRMNRFTLRTQSKVDVQWRLFALVHDIGKIHNYGIHH